MGSSTGKTVRRGSDRSRQNWREGTANHPNATSVAGWQNTRRRLLPPRQSRSRCKPGSPSLALRRGSATGQVVRLRDEQLRPGAKLALETADAVHEFGKPHQARGCRTITKIRLADHVGQILDRDVLVLGQRRVHLGNRARIALDRIVGLFQCGEDRDAKLWVGV